MLKHPVPDSHLKLIGDITVSFALLEHTIQDLTSSMLNEHQRIGQIITAELPFRNLRGLLLSLYRERHGEGEDFTILNKYMKRAGKIEEDRNRIIHSIWAAGKDINHVTRIKTTAKEKNGLSFQFEEFSSEKLEELATKIKTLAGEIQALMIRLIKNGKAINNPIKKMWP